MIVFILWVDQRGIVDGSRILSIEVTEEFQHNCGINTFGCKKNRYFVWFTIVIANTKKLDYTIILCVSSKQSRHVWQRGGTEGKCLCLL